ncbi:MAG TPA: nickel pincer cofactor biosynthesis protein LarB [Granulicella sp.]
MLRESWLSLLRSYKSGEASEAEVMDRLEHLPYEDIGFARIDHHRALRSGMPEVIYAEGKTPEQVASIFERLVATGVPVLATRANAAHAAAVSAVLPQAQYHELARCITLAGQDTSQQDRGHIAVVCAGTSDLPVAEEAALTSELFGARVTRLCDVGVAGLHRLLAHLSELRSADVVIACAGMEGALPSVIGGLVAVPVIAVPTSVGYGASFKGVTALLGMLNSCSPNISVVNIDNGFGAGYLACLMTKPGRHSS